MTDSQENQDNIKLPFFGIPKILPFMKPYRVTIFFMVLCGLIGSGGDVVLPLFQRYALNHYVALNTLDTIVIFIVLYVLTLFVQVASNFGATYLASYTETHAGGDLREAAFNHLQTLSFSYFNQNNVGYIHARVMSDTARIGELVSWVMMDGVWHISYIVGAAVVMLVMNAKLALLVLALVPLAGILIAVFQGKLTKLNRKIREINSRITSNFNEGITGAKTIKSLVIEEKMGADFRADSGKMKSTALSATHNNALFGVTITFASSFALGLVLWRGGLITQQGLMELGTLSVFMSYAQGMMEPIRWIIDAVSNLIAAQVNIERLTKLINTESDVSDTPEVIAKYGDTFNPIRENWESLHGDIKFDDVTFKYPDGDEYILEHFNLDIAQGKSVAIVGETGAGKSTLANLVCRFFEPTTGRILIDGIDVRERSQLWLHSNIGYVLQTPHLFSGSVRENLLYGNPDATDEQIWQALRDVSAETVVEHIEGGLNGEVGEGGSMLSTGEKQLLSFARAILADPKILILDEATASVDTITEQRIQNAIVKLTHGRTSIVIAHRLSTIRNSDMILVVNAGKIVERGTHDELMSQNGQYRSLYTRQYEDDATMALLS